MQLLARFKLENKSHLLFAVFHITHDDKLMVYTTYCHLRDRDHQCYNATYILLLSRKYYPIKSIKFWDHLRIRYRAEIRKNFADFSFYENLLFWPCHWVTATVFTINSQNSDKNKNV